MLDICAWHAAQPIILESLLKASDQDFNHDINGIRQHVDRKACRPNQQVINRMKEWRARTARSLANVKQRGLDSISGKR